MNKFPLAGDINWMETVIYIKNASNDVYVTFPLAGDINWMETNSLNLILSKTFSTFPLAGDINWMETQVGYNPAVISLFIPTRWGY